MNQFTELFRVFDLELRALGESYINLITHSRSVSIPQDIIKYKFKECDHIKEYYSAVNGSCFGNEQIDPFELVETNYNLTCIHRWGNGDFDVVVVGEHSQYDVGTVLFANHNWDTLAHIADNLLSWFVMLKTELVSTGVVWHPMDYLRTGCQDTHHGAYRTVISQLKGVDCELFKK